MRLGVNIFNSIVEFFQNVGETLTLEYMLYGFIALEVLLIIVFSVIIHNVYELKLIRAIDKINGYLYNNQYIDETNLIEFNNRMKKVPKTLRYHWQQYMLYREHSPSYYMSIENCIDRPIKSSAFGTNIKVVKILGYILSMISLILSCGALALSGSTGAGFYVAALTTPVLILVINSIFVLALQIKKSTNLSDLYQTFHIFDRFIDKAVATLPEYVDYEVLFTRAEIKKGIPVLNEYIEKRQLQEQEEMKRARLNAVEHEQYNFEAAGDKGTLVLERAMKETETFINLKHRLMTEIEQLEGEMESIKRTYDNKTKDYQKNTQTARENIDRLREQMEATTNRIESNYIRKQQTDEVKKLEQLDRDQDDATLRYNQEINSLTEEVNKRKEELEEGRKYVESAMLAEYKTFANKVFKDVRADVDKRVKDERDELVNSREMVISELENSLSEVEKLEKENSDYFVLQEFMDAAARKMKSDEAYKEQFIQDYLFASGVADGALKAATKENDKKLLKVAKDNIDAFFINSGVATCDNLQAIYAPKVEQNKTNLDYLKQVISVMQMLNCTEQEAYFAASEAAHAIEPTAETAVGCGYMYYKKGDMDKCIDYFDQAINLEQDPLKKADYAYKTAAILFSKKQLSKAKQYALKSISLDGNNGKPYILIANMYASSPNWSDEAALNKCTYFAVIDKLQKAKSVDPSVAEEANKLIGTYAAHTPKDADLFFLSLKKGDSVTIGGWIGETTTIR